LHVNGNPFQEYFETLLGKALTAEEALEMYKTSLEEAFRSALKDECQELLENLVNACETHPNEHLNYIPATIRFNEVDGELEGTPPQFEEELLYHFNYGGSCKGKVDILKSIPRGVSRAELTEAPQTDTTVKLLASLDEYEKRGKEFPKLVEAILTHISTLMYS
jgi:hypothetical protein